MDADRFGALTKSLAGGQSRRGLLRGALATAAGAGMAVAGLKHATAITCCTGYGGVTPHASGGNSTSCCRDEDGYACYARNGRKLKCGPFLRGEGGKTGCCKPANTACINAILTYPAVPGWCVVVP